MLAGALDAGDVAALQLRLKDAGDDEVRRACDLLGPVARERDVAFILNDRPDLAAETGCDGVHVGGNDAPYREARRVVGAEAIVGVSCYDSYDRAIEAADAGADYVAFGAFYPTATKEPRGRPSLELLRDWTTVTTVPAVAIGGIKVDNCAPLVAAGVDFLAVVTGVWDYPDGPGAAVAAFNEAIASALTDHD